MWNYNLIANLIQGKIKLVFSLMLFLTFLIAILNNFPLDPKTGTTIFLSMLQCYNWDYIPFNVTIHIYTCQRIHKAHSINPGLEHNLHSVDHIYKIPWAKNHHAQNHG